MKRRTLRNKVYRLPKTDIKPIRSDDDDSDTEFERQYRKKFFESAVRGVKYIKGKFRNPLPPIAEFFLNIQHGLRGYVRDVGVRFEAKFDMGISVFFKQLAKSVTVYAVVFLIIVVLILTMKYLL